MKHGIYPSPNFQRLHADLRKSTFLLIIRRGQPSPAPSSDGMVPAQAKVSSKRWANLRSDLSAAITASGLIMMLKTADVERGTRLGPAFSTAGARSWAFPAAPLGDAAADQPEGNERR